MEILTSVRRLYISFKSLVNDFVYSFGRAALLVLVEVQNHTVPVRERGRIRVNRERIKTSGESGIPTFALLLVFRYLQMLYNLCGLCGVEFKSC